MARKPAAPPPTEVPQLGRDEIVRGVAKLKKRLDEVRALDANTVPAGDQRIENAERAIVAAILETYGPNSPHYRDNQYHRIWHGPQRVGMSKADLQRGFAAGIPQTVTLLEGLIADLEERLAEQTQDPTARVRAAFRDLDLHPRIGAVAADLYRDGHYRNAVLDAAVALVNFVKEKSRRHDLDGAALMRTVFSRNNPLLAFNDLADQSQQDEQEGLMHLFEGAVLAYRNPRAHDLVADSAEYALESIAFLSMLAKRVARARRTQP